MTRLHSSRSIVDPQAERALSMSVIAQILTSLVLTKTRIDDGMFHNCMWHIQRVDLFLVQDHHVKGMFVFITLWHEQ